MARNGRNILLLRQTMPSGQGHLDFGGCVITVKLYQLLISDLDQEDELSGKRLTRILTDDFPRYFALVTKVREEKQYVGEDGGVISSTVVPQVQAVFPEGALTKKIKVGLQV